MARVPPSAPYDKPLTRIPSKLFPQSTVQNRVVFPEHIYIRAKPWGYNGYVIWGLFAAVTAWGFWKVGQTNKQARFVAQFNLDQSVTNNIKKLRNITFFRSTKASLRKDRIAILPYLQSESDFQ
jgi:hypothetical protein